LTSGNTRRPDRVIIKDGKAIIIDFKFGEESDLHIEQVDLYSSLLADMGYNNIEAFIWYVDKNKVVSA
jgi:ATP-dependent helicase/nuclease subunit A